MTRNDHFLDEVAGPHATTTGGGVDFLGLALRHKWLILFFAATGLAIGYLYLLQCVPIFQSSARLLVLKQAPTVVNENIDARVGADDSLLTHILMMRSPEVAARAVRNGNLGDLSIMEGKDPGTVVVLGFSANPTRIGPEQSRNAIDVTFQSENPDDCPIVLKALIEAYQVFLAETYQDISAQTLDLIRKAKDELNRELREKEELYREFRGDSALLFTAKEGANPHEQVLTEINRQLAAVKSAKTNLMVERDSLQAALSSGEDTSALLLLIDRFKDASRGPGGNEALQDIADSRIFTLQVQEQELLQQHGPDHPKVAQVRKNLQMARQMFGANDKDDKPPTPAGLVRTYLSVLDHELRTAAQKESEFLKARNAEADSARVLADMMMRDDELRGEIDRLRRLFDQVQSKLSEISLVKDYSGFRTKLLTLPSPGYQVEPRPSRVLMMALGIGAALGFGLAYLLEVADKSFRNPEDIRRRLGLPVVGHISLLPPEAVEPAPGGRGGPKPLGSMHPSLITYHQPNSPEAESYRAVRTAVFFSQTHQDCKIIQITSPSVADGKSTLSANLAISIAQAGKRTLLIDADFRKPRQHELFGVSRKPGFASLIVGESSLQDSFQKPAIDNLWLLTCGPRVASPAELLASTRIQEIYQVLREYFDFVIVDSPPVLAVTDPCIIAPFADRVLLNLRINSRSQPQAARSLEMLRAVNARLLGVTVNGVHISGQVRRSRYYKLDGGSYADLYGMIGGHMYDAGNPGYGSNDRYYDDRMANAPSDHVQPLPARTGAPKL